ncbi:alpha/beta fold hydrolase [Thermomonospora umbrina]|uniref:Pimeloyl-ACP methyl ester carboxylesterase n=1 Tax=Thermomonospora umbrina TaxID=111806 RepID=A0A3D9SW73_9ACTN|nr:alpha/beta hydrolase [Thermomonospora umbrina]REF00193.1 pimeloyl-ACP methyl ester carboxylesterase [Thermomonospora umbrina]
MPKVTSRDGTPIAYERWGEGPPLIYVGGAFNDRSAATPLAERLSSRFAVYSYDRRGRGDSGDTQPYAVDREIEDLRAVIDEAGGSAYAYGMSSGAALVLEAAARGVPITRLALYEPPYNPAGDGERMRLTKEYATRLTTILADRRDADAAELFLRVVEIPEEVLAEIQGSPAWAGLVALAPTLAYDSAVMRDAEGGCLPTEEVAAVEAPTLVLSGGAGPAWFAQVADQVAGAVRNGRHRVLEGQTHDVDPAVLAPALEEFLTG